MSARHVRTLSLMAWMSITTLSVDRLALAQSQDAAVSPPPPSADAGALAPANAADAAATPIAPPAETTPEPAVQPSTEVQAAGEITTSEAAVESEETADESEVMVVSARRRRESLQSVPVAVTALSAEDLESRNVESSTSLSQFTPNLQLEGAAALSGSSSNATAFIRGIGQNDFAIFSDPGVGVYVDDVYMGRSIGGVLDIVDLERAEVLRGPQGTLFGRNTMGGAVLMTSKRPSYQPGGFLDLTGGSYFRNDIRGMVNAPLIDNKLSVRLALGRLNRNGYGKRLSDGEEMGNINRVAGKAQILWDPTRKVSVVVSLDGTRAREKSAVTSLTSVAPGGYPFLNIFNTLVAPNQGITSPTGSNVIDSSWIPRNRFRSYGTGPNVSNLDVWGISATPSWQITPELSIKSITAYRSMNAKFGRDGDNTPFTYRETQQDVDQWQVSQELQVSGDHFADRFSWLAGVYYFQEHAQENANASLAQGVFEALEALPGPQAFPPGGPPATMPVHGGPGNPANIGTDLVVDIFNKVKNRSIAGFANASFKIIAPLSVNAGVRVTYDHKDFSLLHQRVASQQYIVGPDFNGPSASWTRVTPRAGIDYQALPNLLTYFSFSTGFKSGGFNGRPLAGAAEVTRYAPENLYAYELGIKTDWFKRKLIANAAGFYYDYRDIQLVVNQTPQNFVSNAAKARLAGFELEVQALPVRGLRIDGALGYLNAAYNQVGQNLSMMQVLPITTDSKLMKAPTITVAAGAEYSYGLPRGFGLLTARIDYSYRTKAYHDVGNNENIAQDGYGLLGARLSWLSESELWNLALFATNLTDEIYRISGNAASPAFGIAENAYGRPREFGVRLTRNF